MGLADKGLGMGFMKNTSGAKSTPDEMEYMKLKASDGGKLSAASFYEETGSMPIAKTLARHYQKGGRGIYDENPLGYTQEPGFVPQPVDRGPRVLPDSFMPWDTTQAVNTQAQPLAQAQPAARRGGGDPWEYRMDGDKVLTRKNNGNWITAQGDARQAILDKKFPDYEGGVEIGARPLTEEEEGGVDIQARPLTEEEEGGDEFSESQEGETPSWWTNNKQGLGRGLGNAASGLLNIAPHLSNIKAYNDMPGVRAPNLQRTVRSEAPNMEAGRQAIRAEGRNAMNRVNASGQGTAAQNAAALASTQSALSRYSGQEARVEAQTDARNAAAANQTQARNMAMLNRHGREETSRDMAKFRGIQGEKNKLASKALGFVKDLRTQKLDDRRMALTERRYDQYGVMQRDAQKYLEENGEWPSWYSGNA